MEVARASSEEVRTKKLAALAAERKAEAAAHRAKFAGPFVKRGALWTKASLLHAAQRKQTYSPLAEG